MVARKKIPPRIEWAIDRLVKAAKSEGLESVQLGITWGETTVGHLSLLGKDGEWSYFWCDDFNWFEGEKVG